MGAAGYITDEAGNIRRLQTDIVQVAALAITASTPVQIAAATAGITMTVMGYQLSTTGSLGSVIFKTGQGSGSGTNEIFRTPLLQGRTPVTSPPMDLGVAPNAAGDNLALDVTVSGTVDGFVLISKRQTKVPA